MLVRPMDDEDHVADDSNLHQHRNDWRCRPSFQIMYEVPIALSASNARNRAESHHPTLVHPPLMHRGRETYSRQACGVCTFAQGHVNSPDHDGLSDCWTGWGGRIL